MTLAEAIEFGICPCGGSLEPFSEGYKCKKCGWRVICE